MIFSEDILNQLLDFLIALVIIYAAYLSTYVPEDHIVPTAVLVIDNNRRRLLDRVARNAAGAHSLRLGNNNLQLSQTGLAQNALLIQPTIRQTPSLQAIIDEVNNLATAYRADSENAYRVLESIESDIDGILEEDGDTGLQNIINDMDNPNTPEGLRRRVNFFGQELNAEGNQASNVVAPAHRLNQSSSSIQGGGDSLTDNTAHAENCSNENNENENISKTENVAKTQSANVKNNNNLTLPESGKPEEFRIKLKYLNDDTRLVKGSPEEIIGDFKKRNFSVELTAQKLVRLVFNGHVLQPDTKTLKACGMFDNCVVHCLVHNKKPVADDQQNSNRGPQQSNNNVNISSTGLGQSNNRNSLGETFLERSSNGPAIVYLGLVAVTFTIIFCWFCRIQYSYLFSWYSTIGLIIMTILFLIMLPIVMLIERDVPT